LALPLLIAADCQKIVEDECYRRGVGALEAELDHDGWHET
jgi:hypothetical protein